MEKFVYLFSEVDAAEASVDGDWEAVRSAAGRQGRQPGGHDPPRRPRPTGLHRDHPGVQRVSAGTAASSRRASGSRSWRPSRRWSEATGKGFGDPANPLLLSCRSGAKFSMPGMMDTVLNLGLNDEITEGIARRHRGPSLRVRPLPTPSAHVRQRRAERPGPRLRARDRRATPCHRGGDRDRVHRRRLEGRGRGVQGRDPHLRGARVPHRSAGSSCTGRPRRCSGPGAGNAPSTTAGRPESPTAWAPP